MLKDVWQKNKLRDHFTTAAFVAAAYVPTVVIAQNDPYADMPSLLGYGAGIFLAMRYGPVADLLNRIRSGRIFMPAAFAKAADAPPHIQDAVKEISKKASLSTLETKIIEDINAYHYKSKVYVGEKLVKHLNEKELGAIIGHEIGHYKEKHESEALLLFTPYAMAVVAGFHHAWDVCQGLWNGAGFSGVKFAAAMLLLNGVNMVYQKIVSSAHKRQTEYRADREAVRLTGDAAALKDALCIIPVLYGDGRVEEEAINIVKQAIRAGNYDFIAELESVMAREETVWGKLTSLHPSLSDRRHNLDEMAVEMTHPVSAPT